MDKDTQFRVLAVKARGISGLAKYMSYICDCDIKEYNSHVLNTLLHDLVEELLRCSTNTNTALSMAVEYSNALNLRKILEDEDNLKAFFKIDNECLAWVISSIRVRDGFGQCINGFVEEWMHEFDQQFTEEWFDNNTNDLQKGE